MTFDLNSFAISDDSRPLHLVNPNDEVTPLYADKEETKPIIINLYGTASKAHKKAVDVMMKKNAKRGKRQATPEELRDESNDFLVTLTASAENLVVDGEKIEAAEDFKKLYANPQYSWVRAQVDAYLGDIANFL